MVVWLDAGVVAFLQPILIPLAIGVFIAYFLVPVVPYLAHQMFGVTKDVV